MVLENGLVIHIWEWNEKAKELGLDKHPNAGLIAQDVEHMFPDAVIKDENGYLMVDLPVLMDMDDLIAKLVLEGGVARLVQDGSSGGGSQLVLKGGKMKSILITVAMLLFASGSFAEDMSTINYSTDNKLLNEVKTRIILDNGLVIHIWE